MRDKRARRQRSPRAMVEGLEERVLFSTFRVINTLDGGQGSLRQAIINANNNPGPDIIDFSIGSGSVTIAPATKLQEITQPVTIDGTTQPGYSGRPLVMISGRGPGFSVGDGLTLSGGASTVKGLVVSGFSGSGIVAKGNGGYVFENNYVGTNAQGNQRFPNAIHGILLEGSNNRVGGLDASKRNVISGNGDDPGHFGKGIGVFLYSGSNSQVIGNYIGLDATGSYALAQRIGVFVRSESTMNIIGGNSPAQRNVISGNSFVGVVVNGEHTTVSGNYIGLDATGTKAVGNERDAVSVDSRNTMIGGAGFESRNVISGNGGVGILFEGGRSNTARSNLLGVTEAGAPLGNSDGVFIRSNQAGVASFDNLIEGNTIANNRRSGVMVVTGTGHRIIGNSINDNGDLGIDLEHGNGANNAQNAPEIESAATNGSITTIRGVLKSAALSDFRIEFYSSPIQDPTGFGEGRTFLGFKEVTTNSSGHAPFEVEVAGTLVYEVTAATATAPDGSTSEFSRAARIEPAAPKVRESVFDFSKPTREVRFRFDQDVSRSIEASDLEIRMLPSGGAWNPTSFQYDVFENMVTFYLPPLGNGNYRATLKGTGVFNVYGTPMGGDVPLDFFELPGDTNRDRSVGFVDLLAVAANFGGPADFAGGDLNGDGRVGFDDLLTVAAAFGSSVPELPVAAAASPAASAAVVKAIGDGPKVGTVRKARNAVVIRR